MHNEVARCCLTCRLTVHSKSNQAQTRARQGTPVYLGQHKNTRPKPGLRCQAACSASLAASSASAPHHAVNGYRAESVSSPDETRSTEPTRCPCSLYIHITRRIYASLHMGHIPPAKPSVVIVGDRSKPCSCRNCLDCLLNKVTSQLPVTSI